MAVINILNWLDYAGQAIISGDTATAAEDIDMAWAKLPDSIRQKMKRPTEQMADRIDAESMTSEEIMQDPRLKAFSPRSLIRGQAQVQDQIAIEVIKDCIKEIVTLLDNNGLYIKREQVVQPTSQKKLAEQPPTKGLPSTLTRETN